jgi:hypothetical protein
LKKIIIGLQFIQLFLLINLFFVVLTPIKTGSVLAHFSPKIPIKELNPSKEVIESCQRYSMDDNQGTIDLRFLKCLDDCLRDEVCSPKANVKCEKDIHQFENLFKKLYSLCLSVEIYEDESSCFKDSISNRIKEVHLDIE